jgi:zinc transport system substrate-binding protein
MKKEHITLIVIVVVLLGTLFFVFAKKNPTASDGNTVQVSASFYPMYFFAKQIGGDKITVTNLTPPGAEPHDFEPSTQDLAHVQDSKLLILNGAVEAWGDKVRGLLTGSGTKVVVAGDGLLSKQLTEDGETMSDPHVWLDPILAKEEVSRITDALAEADPANADYYHQNSALVAGKLDALDTEYRDGLASCVRKDIVTSHEAFAYLSARYGLNQVPISGLSPDAEPTAAELAHVTDFARSHDVKYIFFESLVSPRLSETIANEVGAQTLVLDPIEGIAEDEQAQGHDYFTVMRDNLKNLRTALQCT